MQTFPVSKCENRAYETAVGEDASRKQKVYLLHFYYYHTYTRSIIIHFKIIYLHLTRFNIRLILLVRDPRGTMQSRNHRDWCPQDPDCYDPSKMCMDMVDDFNYAEKLRVQYPDRFLYVYQTHKFTQFVNSTKIIMCNNHVCLKISGQFATKTCPSAHMNQCKKSSNSFVFSITPKWRDF